MNYITKMLFLICVSPDEHDPGCRICGHAEIQVPSKSFCPNPLTHCCHVHDWSSLATRSRVKGAGQKGMPIWCLKSNMPKILPLRTSHRQELLRWPCYCKGSWDILFSMEEGRNGFAGELGICCVLQAVLQLVCKIFAVGASLAVLNMMSYV